MIEDITAAKQDQERAMVRQKLESLGVLASGIAHDFNNLLGSILAEAELAETEIPDGSSATAEIRSIKALSIRAAEVVRELMIFAGQEEANLEPVDLSQLVEEMLELLKISISKHATLKTDLGKGLPAVLGNATQIRQMVMNLVINASEAIGENAGLVTVTTSRTTWGWYWAKYGANNAPPGEFLCLGISDTGTGMTEEQKARIFDPFYTTKSAGRGLGLSAVQGIVNAHSGTIHLTSTPGRGTTFHIFLPCTVEPAKQEQSTLLPVLSRQACGETVLLVEDEQQLLSSVSKMLRSKNFCVIQATDGSAAIDLIPTLEALDAILLDMTIPGARRVWPDVKIILTSAYSKAMVAHGLGAPQIHGFIRKPYRLSELVQLLSDTLSPEAETQRQRQAAR
jgi:nitrogen-specific signal transduction histidine kinase